jgi:hypothetical protein
MALVIFWVALVAAMRTRMSLRLGISDIRYQRSGIRDQVSEVRISDRRATWPPDT